MLIIGALGVVADHGNTGARWGQASKFLTILGASICNERSLPFTRQA